MSKLIPVGDKILIQPIAAAEKTAGGLFIPKTAAQEKDAIRGRVVAVGPGRLLDNGEIVSPQVEEGDEVLFMTGRIEVEFNGERLFVVQERDLLGVVVE